MPSAPARARNATPPALAPRRHEALGLKGRLAAVYAILAVLNIGAWVWAFAAFHANATLIGVSLVVYGLGLRHAVDADHIAAIDNVTRKLMQDRRQPVTVGFFFALGHSTVVVIVAAAVAAATTLLGRFDALKTVGGIVGTLVSALFLFAIAAMNVAVFLSVFRTYRRLRRDGVYVEEDLDVLLSGRGLLARLFRPAFRLVSRSWHMFPLGILFGLGFDTATEVAVFGVSAAQAGKSVPVTAILVFPTLFAAGMSLVDTTDGVMMLGAYRWAFVKPMRKIYYNLTITLVSIVVAVLIGGVEALGLVGEHLAAKGSFWSGIGTLNDNFNALGFAIIGVFVVAWVVSFTIYKVKRFDDIQVRTCVLAVFLVLAGAALVAPTHLAAADLPYVPAPIVSAKSPWEGFYAGGNVGSVFAGSSAFATNGGSPSIGRTSVVGEEHIDGAHGYGPLSGGFQAGYTHVTPSGLLLGAEADFSFPGILRSNLGQNTAGLGPAVTNDNVQIYGSLGGRVGYAQGNWAVYGLGGFAYERSRVTTTDYASGNVDDDVYFWRPGWTAGAGVEALLTSKLSAKLEYAFFDFDRANAYLPMAGETYRSDLRFQTVRLGLNYHFNNDTVAPGTTGGILPQSVRDRLSLHAQATIIGQGDAPFPAAYSGANSLNQFGEVRDTFSVTGFFGFKDPYEGTEVYYNPEPFQGFGLSNTHGLAAFSNIEAQKAGYDFPHYNTARLFIRHVFGLGGGTEDIEDGPNQVAETLDKNRLIFTFGKLAVGDIFDNNSYSHDGRTQFMNWGLVDAGAFNYSADQQGYTYGTALELIEKGWAARVGYFLVPDVSNGENLDLRVGRRGQTIVELQHDYSLFGKDGILRVLAFETQFNAGSFAATLNDPALINPATDGGTPDLAATRKTRSQYGFVGNAELAATKDLGLFARAAWWNGQSEILYTDITSSFSIGAVLAGTSWGRPLDRIGLADAVGGISGNYQKYLSIGGLGVNIGDGALSYRPEEIVEAYYLYSLSPNASFTVDYQFAANPGYNAVRGPVSIGSVRLHLAF